MGSLLLLNGSPKGERSNSMFMMAQVAKGWEAAGGDAPTVLHLAKKADFERAVTEFPRAGTVLLGMPLYTDSMPGVVARFIEELEPLVGGHNNPRMAFLVQGGFIEATHSRGLERYLTKLAARLGSPGAGTIVRGGGESLQEMPESALGKVFGGLQALGGRLAHGGRFDPETLKVVAGTERFSKGMAAVVSLAFKVPLVQFYWIRQLKKNGAWERRFDAPYGPAA
jgi:hypothetical protein